MTATDELRAMLDERGVEWRDYGYENHVWWCDWHAENRHSVNGLYVKVEAVITPEQAIAATLGAGTCKDVCSGVSEFTCSACGFNCDLTSWISLFDGDDGRHRHHHHGTPHYCPNCGRKVVDE